MQLKEISNDQLSQKNFDKWNSYGIKVTREVYDKPKSFVPIKNTKWQNKAFRLTEKGVSTGIFEEIPEQNVNIMDEQILNSLQNVNAN